MFDKDAFVSKIILINEAGETLAEFNGAFPVMIGGKINLTTGGYRGDIEGGMPEEPGETKTYEVLGVLQTDVKLDSGLFETPTMVTCISVRTIK